MTSNTPPSQAMRRLTRRRLPKLLRKAIADYTAFAAQPPPEDAKGFAAHQAACKSALAHLDAGLKLLAWAEVPFAPGTGGDDELIRLIEAAEAAVSGTGQASGDGDQDPFTE